MRSCMCRAVEDLDPTYHIGRSPELSVGGKNCCYYLMLLACRMYILYANLRVKGGKTKKQPRHFWEKALAEEFSASAKSNKTERLHAARTCGAVKSYMLRGPEHAARAAAVGSSREMGPKATATPRPRLRLTCTCAHLSLTPRPPATSRSPRARGSNTLPTDLPTPTRRDAGLRQRCSGNAHRAQRHPPQPVPPNHSRPKCTPPRADPSPSQAGEDFRGIMGARTYHMYELSRRPPFPLHTCRVTDHNITEMPRSPVTHGTRSPTFEGRCTSPAAWLSAPGCRSSTRLRGACAEPRTRPPRRSLPRSDARRSALYPTRRSWS